MRTIDVAQGTPEWLQARAGLITASRIKDVMAKIKTGEAATRRDYKAQIVAEILTGQPQERGYINAEMQWGTEQEPFARAAYETQNGLLVDQVGLVLHPTIDRAGASPDGLVGTPGEIGLVEVKCPKTATHIEYLRSKTIPMDYQPQMLWQMACTGAAWCDFVSFDPRLPEHLQLFVIRFHRNNDRITEIEIEVKAFLAEVDQIISELPPAPLPADLSAFTAHDA